MKKLTKNNYIFLFFFFSSMLLSKGLFAQDDSIPATPVVKLHYFNNNNSLQYLLLESMLKKGKIFTPQKNKTYELYLDSSIAEKLIAKIQTNENGKAKVFIPPPLKIAWDALPKHTFIVKAGDGEVIADYAITKAKITLDTSTTDGVRSITAAVMNLVHNEWMPAKDVEMKLGIQRNGSILSAGDEATYTTDSSGSVTVELKKDSMPGDMKGNYVLAARVEDNDQFGNLLVEKTVPWGVVTKPDTNFFDQRTLWSTRFKTPYWLLLIAYSIVIGVWGTLIYLVIQFFKIKKLGVPLITKTGSVNSGKTK